MLLLTCIVHLGLLRCLLYITVLKHWPILRIEFLLDIALGYRGRRVSQKRLNLERLVTEMKLFSWIHEKLSKASHADSNKTSNSALHSSCESYASDLEEKKTPKSPTSGIQIHEFELCLSDCCLVGDVSFETAFRTYQDRISVILSHVQFGLLAIGTFGVNSFEDEPELKSLHVKQMPLQTENFQWMKKKHLGDSATGVFGVDKGEDEVQIRRICDHLADQNGSENNKASKSSRFLESQNKRNFQRVNHSERRKKVHPFNKTESRAKNDEIVTDIRIKEKLRNKLLKHCRILGSCFSSSIELAPRKHGTIEPEYSTPRKKSLISGLKTTLCSEKYSAVPIAAQNSINCHNPYQNKRISRNTTRDKELQTTNMNERAGTTVSDSEGPVTWTDRPGTWTAVTDEAHQKSLVHIAMHNHVQPRERALRNPVNENWIKTDSEYVVLECL